MSEVVRMLDYGKVIMVQVVNTKEQTIKVRFLWRDKERSRKWQYEHENNQRNTLMPDSTPNRLGVYQGSG